MLEKVTLRDGHSWSINEGVGWFCRVLDLLERSNTAEVGRVAKSFRLDTKSRKKDDNRMELDSERRTHKARKINKALAMELAMSAVLTFVGSPREVKCFCALNKKGKPKHFAPAGMVDVLVEPSPSRPSFLIVCEVSSNRGINTDTFGRQLKGTLSHCVETRDEREVDVTYGLMVNPAKIGEDSQIGRLYRAFLN